MNRRKFVITSTISMLVIVAVVAGLSFFSNFAARAFVQEVPRAVHHLPADSQAVFGINVQKFVASPVYAMFMQKHGQEVGADLGEFINATGVDPRTDIDYIIAAGRPSQQKGAGVVIAVGRFDANRITAFINTKSTPIALEYKGARVLMIPEANGARLEKGIAFLGSSEMALGDLESLHAVIDVRGGFPGIDSNATLTSLLQNLNAADMFWFAGDGASIMAKAPANTPLGPTLSAIQSIFGTLNLTTTVNGKITVTATDMKAAGQLSDFVKGLLALGQLAGSQSPELAQLVQTVQVAQPAGSSQFEITVNFPIDLLQKLQESTSHLKGQIK
jgi:hypothetical protein